MKAIKPRYLIAISAVLCAVLLFIVIVMLNPSDDVVLPETEQETALVLNSLDILKGDGKSFNLDEIPSRIHAAIMIVRLLGEEEQAVEAYAAGEIENPFSDVIDAWAIPYTAWLYERGLSRGNGDGTFGTDSCTTETYATLLLRALGYRDTAEDGGEVDFTAETALKLAKKLGIYEDAFADEIFDRGLMARMTYLALAADVRDTKENLLLTLTRAGAVDPYAALPLLEAFGEASHLDKIDMNGKTITFLTDTGRHSVIGGYRPLLGREQGDTVDTALYNRTAYIEARGSVTLQESFISADLWLQSVRLAVESGDNTYDVLVGSARNTVSAAASGYLRDLGTLSNIDLSNPWWNDAVNASMNIAGRQIALSGDLLGSERAAQMALYYSPAVIRKLGFEDPADIAQRGEWTLDVLLEISAAHAKAYPSAPLTLLADRNLTQYLYNSTGRRLIDRTEEGLLSFAMDGEYASAMMSKYFSVPSVWFSDSFENVNPAANLRAGQLLFVVDSVANAKQYLGSSLGLAIVPMPKLTSIQDNYATPVSFAELQVISLPSTQKNDKIGLLLEMMGKHSQTPERVFAATFGAGNNKKMLSLLDQNVIVDPVGLSAGLDHVLHDYADKKGKFTDVLSKYRYQIESEISDINGLLLAQEQ